MKTNWKLLPIWFLLLGSLCLETSCEKEETIPAEPPTLNITDSLTLIDFYNSMKGSEWLDPWDLSDPTTWHNIKYEYDPETKLKYVTEIWVNRFYCVEGSRLPETLGNLKQLNTFYVTEAPGLEGGIPESLYDCPIRYLYFQNAPTLQGPLSPSIGKLANTADQIVIGNCPQFMSEIPAELGKCTKAHYILLGWSFFYGKVPIELRNLKTSPMLVHNVLSEVDWRFFTEDIGVVPEMKYNNFTGEIPEEVLQTARWKRWGVFAFYHFNENYGFSNFVYM